MDGRAEGMRIERDPTMDHRIVHSVCVYNKKEQAQLKDIERNLQNEFKVEQHIIRREEKELLKQFQKLQLEKYHRHPEDLHSPRPSFRRVVTPHITVPSRHSMHRSPMSSRHELVDRSRRNTIHHPSGQSTASNLAVTSSHIYPTYPSSSYMSSNIGSSYVSSNYSLKRGTDSRPYLPVLDPQTRNPGSLTASRDDFRRHEGAPDSDHDTIHRDSHSKKFPHHPHHHHHHHQHHHHHHVSNEIQGLLESYLSPHQPAGYGHSIKDLNEHKDTIRRRHRMHHDSHKHRRHTVDFDCPQNYRQVGVLHLFNEIGPYGHKTVPQKSNQPDDKICTTDRPMKHDNEPFTDKMKQQHRGSDTVDRKTENRDVTAVFSDRKPGDGAEILHKKKGDVVDRVKKQHDVTDKKGNTVKERNEQNLQITIKVKRKERDDKTGKKQGVAFTTKGTETNDGAVSTLKETAVDTTKQRSTATHHSVAKSHSSLTSTRKEITPVVRVPSPKEQHDTQYISSEKDSTGSSNHDSSVDLPSDMLAELQALSASSTQGFFTAQGSGLTSRRNRFKQLAKELLMKQIPALTRKRQLAEFDPLEALQCRYLRLSPSNIQDLVDKCKEMGIEVGIHPHSTIEDINEFVFGKDSHSSPENDNK